ncbi:MAG TPA: MaoC family dehydratase [Acidimicrobiales bacterium]|jgi:acyl dehydratase|nr:MaoC family dehydratase [Acidimicrobiales bacterium]
MAGMWYEELEVGLVIKHAQTRTVTETDNVLFNALTMNPQPLHVDEEFSKGSPYGTRIMNSVFTLGLVTGIPVFETTLGTTIGNLGFQEISFPKPVLHGDTISVETEILDKRPSKSRPGEGIVSFAHRGTNQRGEVICVVRRTALMAMKPA